MDKRLDILITGGSGQVGTALQQIVWPPRVMLHAPARADMDLADGASIHRAFAARPFAAVINAGAWTAVDKAETHLEAAFQINAMAPAALAALSSRAGIPMVQVSTDYVFDGAKDDAYGEGDAVRPLGVYGASKLAGELAVRAGNPRSVVLRTSWIVSASGSNFLKTMLKLADTRPELRVVDDQHGCPTSARDVAEAIRTIILRLVADPDAPTGIYHFVNSGDTTWAGFAREIFAISRAAGGPHAEVTGIPTQEYPTAALRPANSRLSTGKLSRDYGIEPRPRSEVLPMLMSELLDQGDVQ